MTAYCETDFTAAESTSGLQSLLNRLFRSLSEAPTRISSKPVERRIAFRLNTFSPIGMRVVARLESGKKISGSIRDLSAEGIAFHLETPVWLRPRDAVTLSFKLFIGGRNQLIKTSARYLGMKKNGEDESIWRFSFSRSLEEGKKDLIHQFVLQEQLAGLRQSA